jgi:hypothetical protein
MAGGARDQQLPLLGRDFAPKGQKTLGDGGRFSVRHC